MVQGNAVIKIILCFTILKEFNKLRWYINYSYLTNKKGKIKNHNAYIFKLLFLLIKFPE